jgi:hypothetical protein
VRETQRAEREIAVRAIKEPLEPYALENSL